MSKALESSIPDPLARKINGGLEADDGFTILVLGIVDGWPHQAMISRGEIVIIGERLLRLALWPTSTMTRALTDHPRATLTAVVDDTSYALRVVVQPAGEVRTPLAGTLMRFDGEVVAASADQAPYATLESGVRFVLHDPSATLARWREVREALRA